MIDVLTKCRPLVDGGDESSSVKICCYFGAITADGDYNDNIQDDVFISCLRAFCRSEHAIESPWYQKTSVVIKSSGVKDVTYFEVNVDSKRRSINHVRKKMISECYLGLDSTNEEIACMKTLISDERQLYLGVNDTPCEVTYYNASQIKSFVVEHAYRDAKDEIRTVQYLVIFYMTWVASTIEELYHNQKTTKPVYRIKCEVVDNFCNTSDSTVVLLNLISTSLEVMKMLSKNVNGDVDVYNIDVLHR